MSFMSNFLLNRTALAMIQRNIRKWISMRNWAWWKLYTRVKPLLSIARQEDEMRKMAEEYEKTKEELDRITKLQKELEQQNVTLLQAKNDMFLQLEAEQANFAQAEERIVNLVKDKSEYEDQVKELEDRLADSENATDEMANFKAKLQAECDDLHKDIEELESTLSKAEKDKQDRDNQIRQLQVSNIYDLFLNLAVLLQYNIIRPPYANLAYIISGGDG